MRQKGVRTHDSELKNLAHAVFLYVFFVCFWSMIALGLGTRLLALFNITISTRFGIQE